MSDKPLVSILAIFYNGGKYIRRFLESALNLQFDNYEIICVDDLSTDDTLEILEEYREMFPDKLFVFPSEEHHGSIGQMRNLAYSHARADYIYWCDQDDILHPCGIGRLYEEAVSNDSDMVCGWAAFVMTSEDNTAQHMLPPKKKPTQNVSNETAIMNGIDIWVRLIKRDLIEKVGPIPEDLFFDDVAYMPVLQSYAEKIRFVDFPIYYYHRRTNSASGSMKREVAEGSVISEKYALEHCNPEYLKAVQYFVAQRTYDNLNFRWRFFDVFVKWIKEQMEWLPDNELVTKNKTLFTAICKIAQITDDAIPNIIYVNGFEKAPTEERLCELREKVFYDGCDITVLSADNCETASNEYIDDAYKNGMTEFTAEYFALKKIYEDGGIYIHDNIRILSFFSYYKNQNAIFFRLDKNTYSNYIFGAPKGNEAIGEILKTYSYKWDKKKQFTPLSERIKIILTAKYDIPVDAPTKSFWKPATVLGANLGAVDIHYGKSICEHDFSDHAGEEDYITVKRSTLVDILANVNTSAASPSVDRKYAALRREYDELKRSNTYKMMMKIRAVGDGPFGPFLKKIFHGLLKIRSKFKK